MGHLSVAYIDDSYLQADLYDDCVQNVIDTVTMFDNLGLVVHPEKSVLVPSQQLVFLGFILDSILRLRRHAELKMLVNNLGIQFYLQ